MSPTRSRGAAGAKQVGGLLALGVVVLGGAIFAVVGGEYSTADLFRQRRIADSLQAEVEALTRVVDSLSAWKTAIETDSATQERLAREQFGMVRGERELLYRVVPRDSGG